MDNEPQSSSQPLKLIMKSKMINYKQTTLNWPLKRLDSLQENKINNNKWKWGKEEKIRYRE